MAKNFDPFISPIAGNKIVAMTFGINCSDDKDDQPLSPSICGKKEKFYGAYNYDTCTKRPGFFNWDCEMLHPPPGDPNGPPPKCKLTEAYHRPKQEGK